MIGQTVVVVYVTRVSTSSEEWPPPHATAPPKRDKSESESLTIVDYSVAQDLRIEHTASERRSDINERHRRTVASELLLCGEAGEQTGGWFGRSETIDCGWRLLEIKEGDSLYKHNMPSPP